MSNNSSSSVYPDESGNIYHVTADTVTVDIVSSWNKAFVMMQELGKRLGFERVKVLTIRDRRTAAQIAGQ